MKNILISTFTIASMLLLPTLRAGNQSAAAVEPQTTEVQAVSDEQQETEVQDESDEGTTVGQASTEGSSTAKKRMWQNIGLAVGAVAIAVTALVLVSQNEGHSHHDH